MGYEGLSGITVRMKGLKIYPSTNERVMLDVRGTYKWDKLREKQTAVGRKESILMYIHIHTIFE